MMLLLRHFLGRAIERRSGGSEAMKPTIIYAVSYSFCGMDHMLTAYETAAKASSLIDSSPDHGIGRSMCAKP